MADRNEMRRIWRNALLVLGGLLMGVVSAWAQQAQVSGFVKDPSGAVIPHATVTIENTATNVRQSTTTNGAGVYTLPVLPPGGYQLTVEAPGFKKKVIDNITLEVAGKVTMNVTLAVGGMSQTVTVNGSGLNINTTDASVSTVIDRQFVENIPLNGRTLQSLLYLTPGVVTSGTPGEGVDNGFSVNGNRDTASANWMVDGVSANLGTNFSGDDPDRFTTGTTAMGTTQSMISLDALQEFRVSTSSYGPEYGTSPGAQIQFESRAGTNQFHGSLYDYLRNTIFDANDWFANADGIPRKAERQNDFGGTLGGPVVIPHVYNGRDKLFFFFNYEGLRLQQPQFLADQPVPTAAFRQSAPTALQPLLNAFPLPNAQSLGNGWGLWNGGFSNPSSINSSSLRLDYAPTSRIQTFARVSYTPSNEQGGVYNSGGQLRESLGQTTTATFGVNLLLSPSLTDEIRLNYSKNAIADGDPLPPSINGGDPAGAEATLLAPVNQYVSPGQAYASVVEFGDPSFPNNDVAALIIANNQPATVDQWDLLDHLTWQLGRHQLKVGGEWQRHALDEDQLAYEDLLEFESIASIQASTLDFGEIRTFPANVGFDITRSAVYAGDTWRTNSRLSLDYGLRWELPFPAAYQGTYAPLYVSSIADLANPTLKQARTQWNMTYRNFAPRLGIAYQLRNAGDFSSVLRTGGGLFYSTETGLFGINGYPEEGERIISGTTYPVNPQLLAPPPTGVITLPYGDLYGVDPNLQLPRVWEWNATVEQGLGRNQSLTTSYVGSAGRRLLFYAEYNIAQYNPNFTTLGYEYNGTSSDYNALQLKFDRRLSHGLQALASYTWSHSIDSASQDRAGLPIWGSSDFDVRNNGSVALVYDIPGLRSNRWSRIASSGWEFSTSFQAHSGLPVDLEASAIYLPDGSFEWTRPNVVPGVPVYLHGSEYPGGTALNPAAFTIPPDEQDGDLGRNELRNQGFWQMDASLQRRIPISEKWGELRLRLDAFNLFNHPNFGFYGAYLPSAATFGRVTEMLNQEGVGAVSPLYGSGGPRSLQISLHYQF